MADERPVWPGVPFEQEWEMGSEGHPAYLRHQHAEAVSLDEIVQAWLFCFIECRRYVHQLSFQPLEAKVRHVFVIGGSSQGLQRQPPTRFTLYPRGTPMPRRYPTRPLDARQR